MSAKRLCMALTPVAAAAAVESAKSKQRMAKRVVLNMSFILVLFTFWTVEI